LFDALFAHAVAFAVKLMAKDDIVFFASSNAIWGGRERRVRWQLRCRL